MIARNRIYSIHVILSLIATQLFFTQVSEAREASCGSEYTVRLSQHRHEIERFLNQSAVALPREKNFSVDGSISVEKGQRQNTQAAQKGGVLGFLLAGAPGAIAGSLAGSALTPNGGQSRTDVAIHGVGYHINPAAQAFAVVSLDKEALAPLFETVDSQSKNFFSNRKQCAKNYLSQLKAIESKYPISTPKSVKSFLRAIQSYNQELSSIRDIRAKNPTACVSLDGIIRDYSEFIRDKKIVFVDLAKNTPVFSDRDVTIFTFEGPIDFGKGPAGGHRLTEDHYAKLALRSRWSPLVWTVEHEPEIYLFKKNKPDWKLVHAKYGKVSIDDFKKEIAATKLVVGPPDFLDGEVERARISYEEFKSRIINANKSGTGSLSNEFTTQRALYAGTSNGKPDFNNACTDAADATPFLARNAEIREIYMSFPDSSVNSPINIGDLPEQVGPSGGSAQSGR